MIFNSYKAYGLLAKLFHWVTFIALIIQIPFGFYLVGLEFSDQRIDLENVHIGNYLTPALNQSIIFLEVKIS
jgi:cytochrome b561